MFTVVEISDGKTGRKRHGRRPELLRVRVPEGSFFYVLRGARHSDPQMLFRIAARCAPVVVTALPVPPGTGVRAFEPRAFPLGRAAAALCAILPQTRLPPQNLSVGVYDPDGALCGGTQKLLPLASDVRIVTRQPERFDGDALLARRRFGASLTVGTDETLLARCHAVVCSAPDPAFRGVPVILSCVPAQDAFFLLPVRLPENLARLCPAGVPADLFAAALAERCGVRTQRLYACRGTGFGAEQLDVCETASAWRMRIGNNFT